jgi:hypothetical protein
MSNGQLGDKKLNAASQPSLIATTRIKDLKIYGFTCHLAFTNSKNLNVNY